MTSHLRRVLIVAVTVTLACSESRFNSPDPDAGPIGDGRDDVGGGGSGASGSGGSGTSSPAGGNGGSSPGGTSSGGASGGTAAGGSSSLEDAGVVVPPHHLGKPFRIVNGAITPDTNEYGLEAYLYVTHGIEESDVNVTSDTGSICVSGELTRSVEGDYTTIWGFDLGFSTGPTEYRGLTENSISIPPNAPPWNFGGRILGMAATITGQMPVDIRFYVVPGGLDPSGQYGVIPDLALYSDCAQGPATESGLVMQSLFLGPLQCLVHSRVPAALERRERGRLLLGHRKPGRCEPGRGPRRARCLRLLPQRHSPRRRRRWT